MKLIPKNSIISCLYHGSLRIVEVTHVRNLTKEPLEQERKSEHVEGAKYLYTVISYGNGSVCDFYDTDMSDVVVLSGKDFTVGKLKERFDKFKKAHIVEQERLQKEKEQEILKQSIPTSGLSPKEDVERLHLDDIRINARIEVVLFETDEEGECKCKFARYTSYSIDYGTVTVFHPGIEVFSHICLDSIKAIYILDEDGCKTPPDPYDGLTLHPQFTIPEYEVQNGYSDEFWFALDDFLDTTSDAIESNDTPKTYRFVLQGGNGYFDKHVCDFKRVQDGKDIEIILCTNGINARPFSIGQFQDIILVS